MVDENFMHSAINQTNDEEENNDKVICPEIK